MSEQEEEQAQEPEASANSDSDAVQAALAGMPGLAESVGGRQEAPGEPDAGAEEPGSEEPAAGGKQEVEDSETVQRALKQLGLQ